jgi:hypothetical protein
VVRNAHSACHISMTDQREKLALALREEINALEGLERLRSRMDVDAFDDEDRNHVKSVMEVRNAACEDLRLKIENLKAQERAYSELREKVSKILEGRVVVLDTENEVLTAHPDLLAKLARKQLEIEGIVKRASSYYLK